MHAHEVPCTTAAPPHGAALQLLAAAALQDHLMVASHDLERLQGLLDDASQTLMRQFSRLDGHLTAGATQAALQDVRSAVTALQFQDLASQLIAHTLQRLRSCADRIAQDTMGDDDDGGSAFVVALPDRPNPVSQHEMDSGSVELF